MARIVDGAGGELIGYVDRFSAQAGERVALMVSTTAADFSVGLVRLRHGDPNPAGPGFRCTPVGSAVDGTYPGRVQEIRCGSYAVIADDAPARTVGVWAWPTWPHADREQVLLQRDRLTLLLGADGRAYVRCGDLEVRGPRLQRERWTCLTVVAADDRLTLAVDASAFTLNGACPPTAGAWHLAADADGRRCFDGKLEEPFAYAGAIAETAAAA